MAGAPDTRPAARPQRRSIKRQNAARLAAVQALYQIEITGITAARVIEEFTAHRIDGSDPEISGGAKANEKLFAEIVQGVRDNAVDIDARLEGFLVDDWTMDRLEVILRCILRAGLYEMSTRIQSPAKSIMREYMRIADSFFDGAEPGLVNGVLDNAARVLRPGELEKSR